MTAINDPIYKLTPICSGRMVGFLCFGEEKSFTSLVRGGAEGKAGRYNIPPHPQANLNLLVTICRAEEFGPRPDQRKASN